MKQWKEEFDEKFVNMPDRLKGDRMAEIFYPTIKQYGEDVKSFISNLLSQKKLELLEKVEKAKVAKEATKINTSGEDYVFVYDIKSLIKDTYK